jgi:guanylate kinase
VPNFGRRKSEFHVGDFDDSQLPHIQGLRRRGMMLALSSPSGAGKTTMTRHLLETDPDVQISISATTRDPRPGEEHGKHYFFVTVSEFQRMVAERELLEHTKIHGHYYGTPRQPVVDALVSGKDILFDIDTPGVEQLEAFAREDLVSIFILPPSPAEMKSRLHSRGQDSEEVIQKRMDDAEGQMREYYKYDYVILNRHLEDSMYKLRTILGAERMKRHRLQGLPDFVVSFCDELKQFQTNS